MPTSVKNLAAGVLSSGITTSSTSISVYCGSGNSTEVLGMWPTAPFYVTISPSTPAVGVSNALDSEIVLVSAVSGGNSGTVTFTVTRAQKGTTAKSFSANDIVSNAVYTDGVVVIGSDGATEMDSPWIENSDIKNGAIAGAKIDWSTVEDIAPSDFITLGTGFSFYSSGANRHTWIKKFGNLIVASIVIASTSPFTTAGVTIGTVNSNYRPNLIWNGSGVVGTAFSAKDIGYFYFNGGGTGQITVSTASTNDNSYLKVKLVYFL